MIKNYELWEIVGINTLGIYPSLFTRKLSLNMFWQVFWLAQLLTAFPLRRAVAEVVKSI